MFHSTKQAVAFQDQQMERGKKKKEKQSYERTIPPLQELNRMPRSTLKNSSISSASSSKSIESPRGCLRFLFPSSSNSSSSTSYSSSRSHHLQGKTKSFSDIATKPISTTPKSAPNSTRLRSKPSKENELPGAASEKPKTNPSLLYQWHSSKKPTLKTTQKSKLSSDLSNSVRNSVTGSEGFGVNQKDLKHNEPENNGSGQPIEQFNFGKVADNMNTVYNCTPLGKLACGSGFNFAPFDDKPVGEESNSANNIVKTPPVEACVSPEIQCGTSNVLVSAATPVCYGAGHLLSGVTDKRKCRPKGILTIGDDIESSGCGKAKVCVDDSNENAKILAKSRPSFIPLPAEASMVWLLSPHGKDDEVQDDSAGQCTTLLSSSIGIPSSPSTTCQVPSDLVSNNSSNLDTTTSTGKTRIVLLSPKVIPSFQGFSESSSKKLDRPLLSATPQVRSSCEAVHQQKERNIGYESIVDFSVGKKSPFSTGSLSCGNAVQTPKSDSSLDWPVNICGIDADDCKRNEFRVDFDSVVETICRASLSPSSDKSMWDRAGLSSELGDLTSPPHSINLTQLQNNLDSCASWISNSTCGNVSLSQMRISWREGLVSRIFDMDEFDCCRCLSDEEKDDYKSDKFQSKAPIAFESIPIEEHDLSGNGALGSPEFLEQEPSILGKGKEKLSLAGTNMCAESISTDGGGLAASGDSDWTLSYKNQLFED